jgi:hypothetical protein
MALNIQCPTHPLPERPSPATLAAMEKASSGGGA